MLETREEKSKNRFPRYLAFSVNCKTVVLTVNLTVTTTTSKNLSCRFLHAQNSFKQSQTNAGVNLAVDNIFSQILISKASVVFPNRATQQANQK